MAGAEDDKVWAAYAKGVKRIKRKRPSSGVISGRSARTSGGKSPESSLSRVGGDISHMAAGHAPLDFHFRGNGAGFSAPLDKRSERGLHRGTVAIEARLDLHGLTQNAAHDALETFLATQIKTGKRNLLIITGKGRAGEGVLRARLQGWLAASGAAPHILALRPAAPKHGGAGAFYVLLRRRKEKDGR